MDSILDLDNNNGNNNYSNNELKNKFSSNPMDEYDLIDDVNYSDRELDENALINCDFSEEIKTKLNSNDELENNNCDLVTDDLLINFDNNHTDIEKSKDLLINFDNNHTDIEKSNDENVNQQAEKSAIQINEKENCPIQDKTGDFTIKQSENSHQSQPIETKTNFDSKLKNQSSSDSKCDVCKKTVYPMEKVSMDSKLYHKNCFRCCVCQKTLSPTVVTKFKDNLFCKPHYIEKFRIRGKYDDIGVGTPTSDSAVSYQNNIKQITEPSAYQYLNSNNINNKKSEYPPNKFVGTKDLASRFQVERFREILKKRNTNNNRNNFSESPIDHTVDNSERKQPIDIGCQRRVSDATRAWKVNQEERQANFRRGNSNNNNSVDSDITQVSKGSVKNLKALFEPRN